MPALLTDSDYLDFYVKHKDEYIAPLFDPDLKVKVNFFRALTSGNTITTHAYTEINGKLFRPRGDLLVLSKDKQQIFVSSEEKYGLNYGVPGGTPDPGVILRKQIVNEAKEEAEILVTNLKFSGIIYTIPYNDLTRPKWHNITLRPLGVKYDGMIVAVYTAIFGKRIDPLEDTVPWDHATATKFRFIDLQDVDLRREHRLAIKKIISKDYKSRLS